VKERMIMQIFSLVHNRLADKVTPWNDLLTLPAAPFAVKKSRREVRRPSNFKIPYCRYSSSSWMTDISGWKATIMDSYL
jgi:hypothetical protein